MVKKLVQKSLLEAIGNTPLVRLNRLGQGAGEIWVKLEFLNPGGSIKDRSALAIVREAEARGKLGPGATIVEATAGNMGISLAMVAAARGYRAVLVIPENVAAEQRYRLLRLGAEVVLSPAREGMAGAMAMVEDMERKNPAYFVARQFENPASCEAHRRTTAAEILKDTGGRVDAFVAGMGTGSTVTGVGQALKEKVAGVRIIGVEPAASPLISQGRSGPHTIPGIGANFIPPLLDRRVLDEVIAVSDAAAQETVLRLSREEGICAGLSGGANVWACMKVAETLGGRKVVVTVLPDGGDRYWNQLLSSEGATETSGNSRGV